MFPKDQFTFIPVTKTEWRDLVSLFEEKPGPQQGCWCMYWRVKRSEWQNQFGDGNKQALKDIVYSGHIPGILAYLNERPIGWCSVAPREHFSVLDRSPTLKRVDDESVWSVVCFFASKPQRRKGLNKILLEAAVEYARDRGARIIEAYPLIMTVKHLLIDRHTGMISTFEKAGFKEILRRSERRAIMRLHLHDQS
jgi:GNAT superfamily N-acetyltransferase